MNREQLMTMTTSQLRALDIKEPNDELLVEEVLAEKMQNEPHLDPNRPVLSSEETDGLTPEKEAELQAQLDGDTVTEVTASEPIDVVTEPVTVSEPVEIPTKKRFCEFCDSKAVRHKKECTRLSANLN